MAVVAANAARIVVNVERGLGGIGELVAKSDVVMDPAADRLGAGPAGSGVAEELPGDVGQLVDFAVTAGEKKRQRVVRQLFDRMLDGVGNPFVGSAAVFDEGLEREVNVAGGREDSRTAVAVEIGEVGERNVRLDDDLFFGAQVGLTRGMDVEHQDHRRGGRDFESNVKTDFDDHRRMRRGGGSGRYFPSAK